MYKAIVTELQSVRPHPNADRLKLATVWGNQIVVGLDAKDGDLGLYFLTDGQLSEEFCKENDLIRRKDENGKKVGGMFDKNRRVRTQKFRGEVSDGFWCPMSYLSYIKNLPNFQNAEELDSIGKHELCCKYVSKKTKQGTPNQKGKKSWESPMFKQHFDTAQLGYKIDDIPDGSHIIITEKLHGTSQRFGYVQLERKRNIFQMLLGLQPKKDWVYMNGTRRVTLNPDKLKSGFHSGEMRQDVVQPFYENLHKGETIYFEVVGYEPSGTPIMGACANKKLKGHVDKEDVNKFIERYGETTTFSYGCEIGECDIYVYRITMTNEDGHSIDYSWEDVKRRCGELNVKHVPQYDIIANYDSVEYREYLLRHCDLLSNGASTIDSTHIREGVAVRVEGGLYPQIFKHKSFEFKVLEGIIKDSGVLDLEEAS